MIKSANWNTQKRERGVKRWISRLATYEKQRGSRIIIFFFCFFASNQFSMCISPRVVVLWWGYFFCRCILVFFHLSVGLNSIFPHNLSHVISSADRGIIDGYLILAEIAGFHHIFFLFHRPYIWHEHFLMFALFLCAFVSTSTNVFVEINSKKTT